MCEIVVDHNPSRTKLDELGVSDWPIWEKETSKFAWSYDTPETCYVLEGEFTVTPDKGEPMRFKAGELIHFPEGLKCTWDVHQLVKKHYRFH